MQDTEVVFYVDGAPYRRKDAEELRNELIKVRNEALKQNDFQWAVVLSHAVALWHCMMIEIWGEK